MSPLPTAARSLARLAAVVVLVVLLATPARAAGTGGIEVTPIPAVADGKTVTAFRVQLPGEEESVDVPFSLRNLTDEPRSARLYVATANRAKDGTFDVGSAGSSDYVEMADAEVQLAAGAAERRTFTVRGEAGEQRYAAVVVEVQRGSVVQRAATVIYLKPPRIIPVPLLLALAAGLLVAVTAGAVFLAMLRREQKRQVR